jgi:polyisoprenyl-teichoic acid--peptidoglycan teichoic acid transferase
MVARADEHVPALTGTRGRTKARPATRFPRYSKPQRFAFVFALLVFAVASFYAGLGMLTRAYPAIFPGENAPFSAVLGQLPGPVKVEQPGAESIFNKRRNILILGLDKRDYEQFESELRADAIVVATVDPITKEASMLSFPRDMYVDIHAPDGSVYQDRINSSYGVGVHEGGTIDAGAKQVMKDLEANFGIETDYWVVLDFLGVEGMIDQFGGIEVDIPEDLAVYDWWYGDESGRVDPHFVSYGPGPTFLDGYNAVAFSRNRDPSDLHRVQRQQLVMQTALLQSFDRGMLADPIGTYNAYNNFAKHNVPVGQIPGLGKLLLDARGRISTYSVGDPVDGVETMEGWITPGGAAVLLWNPDNVRYWINQAFTKSTYSSSNVEIQNGYGFGGDEEVGKLGRYLRFVKGFPTVYRGPEAPLQPTSSIVLYRENRMEMALDIAEWMGLPETAIKVEQNTDTTLPDLIIIIGEDFVVPGG